MKHPSIPFATIEADDTIHTHNLKGEPLKAYKSLSEPTRRSAHPVCTRRWENKDRSVRKSILPAFRGRRAQTKSILPALRGGRAPYLPCTVRAACSVAKSKHAATYVAKTARFGPCELRRLPTVGTDVAPPELERHQSYTRMTCCTGARHMGQSAAAACSSPKKCAQTPQTARWPHGASR